MKHVPFVVGYIVLGLWIASCSISEGSDENGADDEVVLEGPIDEIFGFEVANLRSGMVWDESAGDIHIGSDCEFNEDGFCNLEIPFITFDQNDAEKTETTLVFATSLTVKPGATLRIRRSSPTIFVVAGEVSIGGAIDASASGSKGYAGGYATDIEDADANGNGSGRGIGKGGPASAGDIRLGAGGAGYCGAGGNGGYKGNGSDENGGLTHGSEEVIPLLGGSSGGFGPEGQGGAGGGALQIAARNIEVLPGGVVTVGGGAGSGNGGGGSGGAVLIESESFSNKGAIAANGGGGGGGIDQSGEDALAEDVQALGGVSETDKVEGGSGAAGMQIEGSKGSFDNRDEPPADEYGGGGGGGAGWIRLNTKEGIEPSSGTISPSLETSCASVGSLELI